MKKAGIMLFNIAFLFLFILIIFTISTDQAMCKTGKKWISVTNDSNGGEKNPTRFNAIESNQNLLTVELKTDGFYVSERLEASKKKYNVIEIGKFNGDLKPGSPNLPTVRQFIYIPSGKVPHLSFELGIGVTLDNYNIYPMPLPEPDVTNLPSPPFSEDKNVYKTDSFLPVEPVFLDKPADIRGHKVALLHICPFRFNPVQKKLIVYPNIKVRISFEGEARTIDKRFDSSSFNKFIKGFVVNPGILGKYAARKTETDVEGAEFLIISAPAFVDAANSLHNHKESIGISTVVKTTADTGTTNTAIKSYIQTAYNTWSPAPSFVLLLGDVEYIPTNYQSIHDYHGNLTGTDLYYSTVSGSDYTPDIFVGRIPVNSLTEAQLVVDKIIAYESSPPSQASFYSNITVAAYFQDYNDNNGYEDRRFLRTAEEMRDYLLTAGYSVERIYNRTLNGVNPTNYNQGTYANGESLPDELLISNGFTWSGDSGDISAAINEGTFLLFHRDHGMDRNDGYAHTGWGDPYYDETHIAGLSNGSLLPVVLSMNCMTGWFDGETDQVSAYNYESFCEEFLKKSNGGAVSLFGATRVSYSGYNDFLTEGIIDSVWPDFLTDVPNNSGSSNQLGPMLNHGKIAMDTLWGDPWGLRKLEYEIFHVIGDPTLQMWTQKPGGDATQTIRIQSDPELSVPLTISPADINGNTNGETNFTRTYTNGTTVTLTAPATFNGRNFLYWDVDNVTNVNNPIQVVMNGYHLVTAQYSEIKTLTLHSSPVEGVPITVSPADNNGLTNGSTSFVRYYTAGQTVTLTAPSSYQGRAFSRWIIDSTPNTALTIQVTMSSNHTITAEYSTLATDKKLLVIDLDGNKNSGPSIKNAITACGYTCDYQTSLTEAISANIYSAVFVCLGVYSSNVELSSTQGTLLKTYLDQGGKLYMEGGDTWAWDSATLVHPYFGIQGVSDGNSDTSTINGVTGKFSEGVSFSYAGDNSYMDQLSVRSGVTNAYVIWNNASPVYTNGIARDTGSYKTIGTSFEFSGIPSSQQISIMEKYLGFFFPGRLCLLTPNVSETLNIGSEYSITWSASNCKGPIKLSIYNNNSLVGEIDEFIDLSRNPYKWTVGKYKGGKTVTPGSGYKIKIEDTGTHEADFSNESFTISSTPIIKVNSPNGGELLALGETGQIKWNAENVSGTLKIVLWQNATKIGTIADNLDATAGSYSWTVGDYIGGTVSPGNTYKVKILENGTTVSDISDDFFTITPAPSITILTPNEGEILTKATVYSITWDYSYITQPLTISLWKDDVELGIITKKVDPSRKSFSWIVGQYEGGIAPVGVGYKIKIQAQGTAYADFSDIAFSMSDYLDCDVTVMSPNGGENLTLGSTHKISWSTFKPTGTLKITLLKNDVQVLEIGDGIDPDSGFFMWQSPVLGLTPASDYKIKIEMNGTAFWDTSNANFSLTAPTLAVVTPNGGENLTSGSDYNITWSLSNGKDLLKLTLWQNDSLVGIIADDVDPSRTSFTWKVGQLVSGTITPGSGFKIKIEEKNALIWDFSNTSFTIQ